MRKSNKVNGKKSIIPGKINISLVENRKNSVKIYFFPPVDFLWNFLICTLLSACVPMVSRWMLTNCSGSTEKLIQINYEACNSVVPCTSSNSHPFWIILLIFHLRPIPQSKNFFFSQTPPLSKPDPDTVTGEMADRKFQYKCKDYAGNWRNP